MSTPRWRVASLCGALLILLTALPAAAAPALRPEDVAAPAGRFVVIWRDHAPARVGISGVDEMRTTVDRQRTVVVAKSGQAGAVGASLRRDPRVLTVVPDAVVTLLDWPSDAAPSDMLFPRQDDLAQINVPAAWKQTTGNPNVVVAFIDTGVDLGHPDIAGVNVVAPRNETYNSTDVNDTYGHGTHTAGTVFARTDNEIGVAGIAPDASLMPIEILDGDGSGFFSDLLDGVDWARTHGADIVSMSVGSWLSSQQVAAFQPTFSLARASGMLLVAAAGNSGSIMKLYPAGLLGVVSVGAVDGADVRADFSTYNTTVDIAAPGVELLSTGITDPSGYERMSGTSMAAPHVAGVAALVWSARPTLTVAELEAVLRGSAVDLGAPGRDDEYGDGRIDALAALTYAVPQPLPDLEPPPAATGEFSMEFLAPAADVRQDGNTFTVRLGLNHEASDAYLVRTKWPIRANRCPTGEDDTGPIDWVTLPFRTSFEETGLEAGACYRWEAAAIDDNDEIVRVTSPSVLIRDHTRPRITVRSPRPGATRVPTDVYVDISFSEDVVGISTSTLRIRNLATGKWVRTSAYYDDLRAFEAYLVPRARLTRNTRYEVIVSSRIRDQSNNALASSRWIFKTRP